MLNYRRTGRYKLLTLGGLAFAVAGYGVIALRWHGKTNWLETLYIIPGGFGMGVAMSTTFIALTAGVAPADLAVAGTGLYQFQGIGAAMGSCITMSILQAALRPMLVQALKPIGASDEVSRNLSCSNRTLMKFMGQVVRRSIEDIAYVRSLKDSLREIVVRCYVRSLVFTHGKLEEQSGVHEVRLTLVSRIDGVFFDGVRSWYIPP